VDVDETLVAKAAKGNRDAFDELVRRYQTRMYQLVRILTGNDEESEDLVQDTFVRAYRALARFRGDSTFRTWLHQIAVNVVRSHVARRGRRRDRARTLDDGDGEEPAIVRIPSAEDLENAIVRRRTIDQALVRLPADMRLLVTLRDIQGLEYREIATITGLPMGTVESRIFRGRRRLRLMLEPLFSKPARRRGN
jgi:RNA polymerase sigma-70 factor (ECF subfamily)